MNWEDLCPGCMGCDEPTLAERMANQALLLERCRSEEWMARAEAAERMAENERDNAAFQRARAEAAEAELAHEKQTGRPWRENYKDSEARLAAVIALCDKQRYSDGGRPYDFAEQVRAAAQGQSDA